MKILYVDDEQINLDLFQLAFRGKYQIDIAITGAEALQKLKDNIDYQIVISDMRMPDMNGIEFIKRANEINNKPNYYILSGYDITPQIHEAIEQKLIKKYFTKPFKKQLIEQEFNAIDK